jgi:hypothetical protein
LRILTDVRRTAARLGAVPLCALAAHALLYRSLAPGDAAHAYLGWYEPAVGVLSLLALSALAALLAVPALRRLAAPLLARERGSPAARCGRLASASFLFLLAQEWAEHALAAGRLEAPLQSPATLALALVCAAVAAAALGLVERLVVSVAARALPRLRRALRPLARLVAPRPHAPSKLRPLASHRALRGPPPVAA